MGGVKGKARAAPFSSNRVGMVGTVGAQLILRAMDVHEVILTNLTKCFRSSDDHCQAVPHKRLSRCMAHQDGMMAQ